MYMYQDVYAQVGRIYFRLSEFSYTLGTIQQWPDEHRHLCSWSYYGLL